MHVVVTSNIFKRGYQSIVVEFVRSKKAGRSTRRFVLVFLLPPPSEESVLLLLFAGRSRESGDGSISLSVHDVHEGVMILHDVHMKVS